MSENSLPAHIFYDALVRRINQDGHSASFIKRGNKDHMPALLWLEYPDRTHALHIYRRDVDFNFRWGVLLPRSDYPNMLIHEKIEKEKNFDQDLWVIAVDLAKSQDFEPNLF